MREGEIGDIDLPNQGHGGLAGPGQGLVGRCGKVVEQLQVGHPAYSQALRTLVMDELGKGEEAVRPRRG